MLMHQTKPARPEERYDHTVLVVDDEPDVAESVADLLLTHLDGVRVLTASDGDEAVAVLHREPVDVVLSDYRMPGMDGLALLRRCHQLQPDVARIMMTAFPRLDVATRAVEEGRIHRYMIKPMDATDLVKAVEEAFAGPNANPLAKHDVDALFDDLPTRFFPGR